MPDEQQAGVHGWPTVSWLELFPWLDEPELLHGLDDVNWEVGPQDARTRDLHLLADQLAVRLVSSEPKLTLATLFPALGRNFELSGLRIGTRMSNALARRGYTVFGTFGGLTIGQILEWSNVGIGSVHTLVAELIIASRNGNVGVEPGGPERPDWLDAVAADIRQIAKWNSAIGRPHSAIFDRDPSLREPSDVGRARSRLAQMTSALVEQASPAGASHVLSAILGRLDSRELDVLRLRTFADSPLKLDQLGERFGVTRERVRQIELRVVEKVSNATTVGVLGGIQQAVRNYVGPLLSLDALLSRLPSIRDDVPEVEQPLWRVLDRLDDSYEIRDGWCAMPSVDAQVEASKAWIALAMDSDNHVALGDAKDDSATANLSELEQREWYRYCGLVELSGYLITRNAGIGDRAAIVLEVEGEPLPAGVIHDRLGVDRSLNATKNALAADGRFARVNRDSWALSGWGLTEYRSIRELIGLEIESAGGEIALSDLVDRLTIRFDVKPQSVMAYAGAHPYRLANGRVHRDGGEEGDPTGRSIWQTPRVHRSGDTWIVRTRITHDHLRGSGSAIPPPLARVLGVERGGARSFGSRTGEQLVSWKSLQPALGSIRRLLDSFAEDDDAFLVFSDDGAFRVEGRRPTSTILDEVLAAAGLPASDGGPPLSALAMSIGLAPDSGIVDIISALRLRRDDDLAEMLEGL